MPAYKIGITEAGDAGVDLSWVDKMGSVDGAVLITKCISPNFVDAAMKFKDKIIVHATITGYGGTILEPLVPYRKRIPKRENRNPLSTWGLIATESV